MQTKVKTDAEIAAMREGGKMLATVLQVLKQRAQVGMSTKDLANIAASELKSLGGSPAFLGYHGYPDVLCVSVNDEVVHGIPSHDVVLEQGNIVGLDFGVFHKSMITDGAISIIVGGSSDQKLNNLCYICYSFLLCSRLSSCRFMGDLFCLLYRHFVENIFIT